MKLPLFFYANLACKYQNYLSFLQTHCIMDLIKKCISRTRKIHEKGENMAISYNKLWKLLIDKNMKKMELRRAAGISTTALAKLGKNENVNTGVLEKICHVLNCQVADIMEITDVEDNCLKREEK